MNWLLVLPHPDAPTCGTTFTYFNYILPLQKLLGNPVKIDTTASVDTLKDIYKNNQLSFVIEIINNTPSKALQEFQKEINLPSTAIVIDRDTTYESSIYQYVNNVWGKHESFPNIIPNGLYHPHYREYPKDKRYDVTYIGTATDGKAQIISHLIKHNVNINVWGYGWEKYKDLRLVAHGYLPHYKKQEIIASSKISLNFDNLSTNYSEKALEILLHHNTLLNYSIEDNSIGRLVNNINHLLNNPDNNSSVEVPNTESVFNSISKLYTSKIDSKDISENNTDLSIICYVYNQEKFIEQMIISVLGQTKKNFELFILDDGSIDSTADIIKKYSHDPRLKYKYQKNIGSKLDMFHKLIEISLENTSGEYVAFIGGDDIFVSNKLENQITLLQQEKADICYTDFKSIEENGKSKNIQMRSKFRNLESDKILRNLYIANFIYHPTTLLKRSLIEDLGGFQTPFASDLHFWLKAANHYKFCFAKDTYILYREHQQGSSTGNYTNSNGIEETLKIYQYFRTINTILDFYPELGEDNQNPTSIANAYTNLSSILMKNKYLLPAVIVTNSERALEHYPFSLSAWNNLIITFLLLGDKQNLSRALQFVNNIKENLQQEERYQEFEQKLAAALQFYETDEDNIKLLNYWMDTAENSVFQECLVGR